MENLRFIQNIVISLILLAFIGCAPKVIPLNAYKDLNRRKAIEISEIKTAAITLKIKKSLSSELNINDSILKYGSDNTKYSNYKTFEIELKPNKRYKLTISSLCDCAGFTKYMFIPLTNVFDEKNALVGTEAQKDNFDYRYGPLSLNKSWIFNTNAIEHFRIIVYSDNSNLNQDLYKYVVRNFPMTIPIKTSLVGKFHILVEDIKE